MTNLVFAAINIIRATNVMDEAADTLRGDVKFRTNVITETHAYEANGRQWFHVMPPTTNVVRMELKWVEVPQGVALRSASSTNDSQPISQANCVTRIYDAILYTEDGTNIVSNGLMESRAKSPPIVLNRAFGEIGKPLTADEAARLCLPPVPQYIEAMTVKKPKL